MSRERTLTAAVFGVLAIAAAVLLLGSSGGHTVYAEFADAGQLVGGDLVTVAGHQVGTVTGLSLADDGLARVKLDIGDDSVWPLRTGTRANIRQLSLTGVANRFVGLTLSEAGSPLPEGGTIGAASTKGIVDLDILLDALTPRVRASIRQILQTGAYTFSGATPRQINAGIPFLDPALSRTAALGREVVSDRFALERLIAGTAAVSSALAADRGALATSVNATAAALGEVAANRSALEDSLLRAPAVLRQARAVLADTSTALGALNPALRNLGPLAPRLAALLRALPPAVAGLRPTLSGLSALVGPAERALTGVASAAPAALPGLRSLTGSLRAVTPILSGLRPYLPDQIAGFFEGVAGSPGASYDANGHFGRISPVIMGTTTSLTGILSVLGSLSSALPVLNGTYTGKLRSCPGGGAPPAADGSNPFTNLDTLPGAGRVCDPAEDQTQ